MQPLITMASIASKPDLARYVKALKLGFNCSYGYYDRCRYVQYGDWRADVEQYVHNLERAVAFALPRMPNIDSVELLGSSREHNEHWASACPREWRTCFTRVTQMILTHFSHPRRKGRLQSWSHLTPLLSDLDTYWQIPQLSEALCNLRCLSITVGGPSDLDSAGDFRGMPPFYARLSDILRLANNLRELTISGGPDHYHYQPSETETLDLSVLLSLPLERLTLHNFQDVDLYNRSFRTFTASGQGKLYSLMLTHAKISAESIMEWLVPNQSVLRYVALNSLYLTSGTWGSIFVYMASQLTRLHELTIYSLRYDPWGESYHLAVEQNDTIIPEDVWDDLKTAELSEFGDLEELRSIVAARAALPERGVAHMSNTNSDEQVRPVFGPKKRKYTLLDKWLDVPPM